MIVLNLAIWTLSAELLHSQHATIKSMDDLPRLLSDVLGRGGRTLFYLGVLAAVFTSLVGHAIGLAYMGSHAWLRWRAGTSTLAADDYRQHALYRVIVVWCLLSPLIWTVPGMPGFVQLTLIVNAAQVMLLPVIAGGLWCITARSKFIGEEFRNRWWENLVMFFLIVLAFYGAFKSVQTVIESIQKLV
jgi:Mn2+/Fe2+ NRAMP family transporter